MCCDVNVRVCVRVCVRACVCVCACLHTHTHNIGKNKSTTYLKKGFSYKDKVHNAKPKLSDHQEDIHNSSAIRGRREKHMS